MSGGVYKAVLMVLLVLLSSAVHAVPIAFNFNFNETDLNDGFNDQVYGVQRRNALNFAGQQWGNVLQASYDRETINVSVSMAALGTNTYLATASGIGYSWNNAAYPHRNTVYSSALANHLYKSDRNTSSDEIKITFNSSFNYYYGTDGRTASGTYDFVSLAMHEITHGLGFNSRIDKDPSDGSIGSLLSVTSSTTNISYKYASIYDRFLVDANGASLLSMTDAGRATAITSEALYWNGANATAANGGVRPELYAPTTAVSGSSITHLDKDTTRDLLMEPSLVRGRPIPADAVTLGMLADMGWTVTAVPEPGSISLMLGGLVCLAAVARRKQLA